MRIERLHVQGYRSLFDVEFKPRHLTVLTGPNNSGKTNVVEAFDFLAEVHRHGLEVAVSRKGGIENITYKRVKRTRRPVTFEYDLRIPLSEVGNYTLTRYARRMGNKPGLLITHRFAIRSVGQSIGSDFLVESEDFQVSAPWTTARVPILRIARSHSEGVTLKVSPKIKRDPDLSPLVDPFHEVGFRRYLNSVLSPTDLLFSVARYNPLLRNLSTRLGAGRLYQLAPLECRRPGVPTPNADLDVHGANLPAMVAHIQKNNPRAWESILAAMQRIVPTLQDVKLDYTSDRRLALKFFEEGVGKAWSAEDMSDGTMQTLALFTALFDTRAPFMLIEEPENSVHPWVVRSLVDACRAATAKQIILTTHSPVLISYVEPEDIVIVWRDRFRTRAQPLIEIDPQARELWESGQVSLFDLVDSGIMLQTVPGI